MPITYVGRVTSFSGKPLTEILAKLKNFGVGRLFYRQKFMSRYEEPSFIVVTNVQQNLSQPTEPTQNKVVAHQYFRGEYIGEIPVLPAYKADWRLVPREDEHELLNYAPEKERERNIIPDTIPLPPLLLRMKLQELAVQGVTPSEPPRIPITIRKGAANRAMLESEAKQLGLLS